MELDTGSFCHDRKQPLEHSAPTEKEKRPTEKKLSSSGFVNHAAIAWHESRRKWIGDQSRRPNRKTKEPIISWSMAYEDLLSTNDPFSEPIPLPGTCGSCWAFSTTGAVEGANFIATGKLLNLSEQQLIDCDHKCDAMDKTACDNGCRGGLMTNAYNYLMEAGGLEEESSYPYTGKPDECKFKREKVAVKVANFTNIPVDENQIAAYLVNHGPLAVGLNAVFMQTYIGGVSCPLICGKKWVNHGVLLVGYGAKGYSILRFGYKPYWIIKNSWGKRWGENGYYHLCRGSGMCGMNTMVSAVATQIS